MTTKKPRKKSRKQSKRKLISLSRYSNVSKALIFAGLFAIMGTSYLFISHALTSPYDTALQARLINNPKQGISFDGLKAVKKDANHPCRGEFEVEGVKTSDGNPLCSHGGDPAPDSIDVTKVNPQEQLDKLNKLPHNMASSADLQNIASSAQSSSLASNNLYTDTFPMFPVPCTTRGYRIQLVLISNIKINPYTALARTLLQQRAHRMEAQLEVSSLISGPGATNRHFRFVTDSHCQPTVATIIVPTTTGLATFTQVTAAVSSHGYNDRHTKYLIWVYANKVDFCGTGTFTSDSNPNSNNNASNNKTGYAAIGPACWGNSVSAELHETMHTLGAVQLNAPHTTGLTHCLDDYDVMCYPDHPGHGKCYYSFAPPMYYYCGANGKNFYTDYRCNNLKLDMLLDCNKDDYFNTGLSGLSANNYLHNHWNVANSPYLQP